MTDQHHDSPQAGADIAPGDEGSSPLSGLQSYILGLVLAILLTAASFWATQTHLLWGPSVPIALIVLAVTQMGVHLAFFLHLTSAPDNTNNILALAFGILIVGLVVVGSLWIMANLNDNMIPMDKLMDMQR